MKFGEAPFLFKEIYWGREQKPQDGPGMNSSLLDQNPSREKRDGYWPLLGQKILTSAYKREISNCKFFYQLIVVFVRTYQINVQFSKIEFFLGIVTF